MIQLTNSRKESCFLKNHFLAKNLTWMTENIHRHYHYY